jgi:hypothetical protein
MEEVHIPSSWRGAIVISILKLRKNFNLVTSYRLIVVGEAVIVEY